MRKELQGKLRHLALRCLAHRDLEDTRSWPALERIRTLIAYFEARRGRDVSVARGSKQGG